MTDARDHRADARPLHRPRRAAAARRPAVVEPAVRPGRPTCPRPKAILIVSAHWESAPVMLQRRTGAPLVYDFGGFAEQYYRMTYDDAGRDRARRSGSPR